MYFFLLKEEKLLGARSKEKEKREFELPTFLPFKRKDQEIYEALVFFLLVS